MKKKLLIYGSVILIAISSGSLSSCSSNKNENVAEFTYLLSKGEDSIYYNNYNENPVVAHMLNQKWNDTKLNIDFYTLVSGSENDQYNTILATGEYYDIMDLTYSNYSAANLYEMDVLLDLTDMVKEYMPNYMKELETNKDLAQVAYSTINGEKKIVQLFGTSDKPQLIFEGFGYRRDWLVKYGKNPSTNEAFSSSYVDGIYSDNVVFPSYYNQKNKDWYINNVDSTWDGSCPIFISDWEWMLSIFDTAIKSLNITDGYCYAPYYTGYMATGDFLSGFGGGSGGWYKDGSKAYFNGDSSVMKSYVECMSTWYSNGWIDKSFNERSSDMFYKIDQPKVHSGKVGLWQAGRADIGNAIEDETYPLTKDMMVFGARQPINDIYGTDENKYHIPNSFYAFTSLNNAVGITVNAKDKDLKSLLTWFDYLYSDEGAIFSHMGFTKEEVEKYDVKFYKERGLVNGIYEREVKDGVTYLRKTDEAAKDDYLHNAAIMNRICVGKTPVKNVDYNLGQIVGLTQKEWGFYESTGYINSNLTSLMTADESSTYAKVSNNINTYMSQEIPKFIKGQNTIEKNWDSYVTTIKKYAPQKVTSAYQRILDEIYGE